MDDQSSYFRGAFPYNSSSMIYVRFEGASTAKPDLFIGIGYVFSFAFFGILVVQTFIYQTRFPDDRKAIKFFVWVVLLLQTLSCVFTLVGFLDGLSLSCLSCAITPLQTPQFIPISCEGLIAILEPAWSFLVLSVLTGLISSMVHGYFCWRLWVINKSLIVPCVVMMISLLQCIMVIYDATGSFRDSTFFNAQATSVGGIPPAWGDYLWLGGSLVCDIIITVQTTRLLFIRKSASDFKNTKSLLTKLIKLVFETGMVTSVATLVELIMAVSLPPFYHLLIFYSLSKLYANCMMATLNARLVLRGDDKNYQVTTALFEAPHTDRTIVSSLRFRHDGQHHRHRTNSYNPASDFDLENFSESENTRSLNHGNQSEDTISAFQAPEVRLTKPIPVLSQSAIDN